jgi:ribosomal protein S6--L-glutamate ligase
MDIGITTVRDAAYHPNRRLLEAGEARGLRLALINPHEVGLEIISGSCGLSNAYVMQLPKVILPRQGAQIGDVSLTVLHHLRGLGIPLINGLTAIMLAKNKFLTLRTLASAGLPVPDTVFIDSAEALREAAPVLGGYPLVLKLPNSRQGAGVFLAEDEKRAKDLIQSCLNTAQGILLQQYLPSSQRRDIRALVIDKHVIGAMELWPAAGDFRSNFHLSGRSRRIELGEELGRLASAAAGALGLSVAGVDMILGADGSPFVVEVNYAPGFRGLEAATGLDVAGAMIEYTASMVPQ